MLPKSKEFRGKECYRSKFEVDRFRSGRGWIEAGNMNRGRAREGPSGLKVAIYVQNYGQILTKIFAIILVTLTSLIHVNVTLVKVDLQESNLRRSPPD